MQKKTLGGDRLGSGSKMQVELHGYERSNHDKGRVFRTTMSAGTLVPYFLEVALPGDTWDIQLGCNVLTHPTVGPLLGSYKVQLDMFLAPMRLYNALMHNNALNIGLKMSSVKFPLLKLTPTPVDIGELADVDNSQINPSAVLNYLGIRGVGVYNGILPVEREFNAIPYLAYVEIYKQYYSNKQEEIGAVIHTDVSAVVTNVQQVDYLDAGYNPIFVLPILPNQDFVTVEAGGYLQLQVNTQVLPKGTDIYFETTLGVKSLEELTDEGILGTGIATFGIKGELGKFGIMGWRYRNAGDMGYTKPEVATFDLADIDTMKEKILAFSSRVTAFDVKAVANTDDLYPYKWLFQISNGRPNLLNSQEGLLVKTYQSDLFNNWLQTEWIDGPDGISAITSIDVSDGLLNLDTLNLAKKVYNMLNRIAVSGGTYDDWLDVTYDHDRYKRSTSPMYLGGLIKELIFQEVVSNAAAEGASGKQELGTLAGKGRMSDKHKGGQLVINVDEPSYIIGIVSLTPRIDYSQGNEWHIHLKTMDDLHKPELSQLGFQELLTEQMAWWDTTYDTGTAKWVTRSAGKQPAWLNYMTSVNKVYGNFAVKDNEMFMVLNRRYEYEPTGTGNIKDLTTYIDPSKFNFIFAQSSLDAQNFWVQIGIEAYARRKMSAKIMPNI